MYRLQSPALFLIIAVFLMSVGFSGALAQANIGIYFDPEFTQNAIEVDGFPATVTGYLVMQNMEGTDPIFGWELCVDLDGPGIFIDWQLEGQTINVLDPPCFMVGIGGDPLPAGDNVLLATFQVLVDSGVPVIFTVDHTFYPSLPGEMVYLTGPEGDELAPLYSVTGNAEVASINGENPVAEVSTTQLYFDEQPIGTETFRSVTVTNIGGGLLYIDPTIMADNEDFTIAQGGGEVYLAGGQSRLIRVAFMPSSVGEITGTLDLGPNAPAVNLHGVGREPIISYTGPTEMEFGDQPVGAELILTALFYNTGEVPIPVAPFLGSCQEFSVVDAGPFVIPPSQARSIQIRFLSYQPGTFECDLLMGDIIEPVHLIGMAHEAVVDFTVEPDTLDFGHLAQGSSRLLSFTIYNTGEAGFEVAPGIDDPTMSFDIVGIDGNTQMSPGDWLMIQVLFQPTGLGYFTSEVTLGEVVPPVPLLGFAEEANPECQVTPTELDFGTVNVGGAVQRFFNVNNTGNVPLEVTPYEDSDHFWIASYPVTIEPGTGGQFMVIFSPLAEGNWETTISLGGTGCDPVHCMGSADYTPPPGEEDLIGIYFDEPYYQQWETYSDIGPVEAYLVLKDVSDPVGVLGWECRHEIAGPAIQIGDFLYGQAINVGTSPDYIVGLAEPLPPTPHVALAMFTYFVLQPYEEVFLLLSPVSTPSIPGQMAYLSGYNPNLIIPMDTWTGTPEVAVINSNPLDVQRPEEPALTATGGQVQLSWDLPEGMYEGYHVYRREGMAEPERLTDTAGRISGQSVMFVDAPQGFAPGTTLYYSYSLVTGGEESARSPEVEYQVQSLPLATTRLLPTLPNPFNPQTRIRFDVAKDGPVRVAIYDVSGRLVRSLVSENMSAGNHEEVWQGRDNSGRQVPSGAYYVRLETTNGVDHRKIMLLK